MSDAGAANWSFGEGVPSRAEPPAEAALAPRLPRPGQRFAGYEVLEPLGRGGMGVVFRARDPRLGRDVALKLHARALDARGRERFAREGRVAANLRHPHLVRLLDGGEWEGTPYLVYELVEQPRGLGDVVDRLPLRRRFELVRDVARALSLAHARGLVHRDVKPDNILIDAEGQAHLTDFGLVLDSGEERLTQTGVLVGTPHYMAPEQLGGREGVGPWSDVWSLGVILFRACTGRLPFQGETLTEVTLEILRGEVPNVARSNPEVPASWARLVARTLARDPAARPRDGAALADELDRLLAPQLPLRRVSGKLLAATLGACVLAALGWLALVFLRPASIGVEADASPRKQALRWQLRGDARAARWDWRGAVAAYDRALALDPDYAEAWASRGHAFFQLGNRVRARGDLERALALNPRNLTGLLAMAVLQSANEHAEEALRCVDEAIRIDPGTARSWSIRAELRRGANDLRGAVADAVRALCLDPYEPISLNVLGLAAREQGRPDLSERLLRRALELGAERPSAYLNLARILRERGRPEQGKPILDEGLRRSPDDVSLLIERGWLAIVARDPAAALRDAGRAISLDPDEPAGGVLRARALWSQGDAATAERELRALSERFPQNVHVLQERYLLLKNQERLEEALALLEQVHQASPGNPWAALEGAQLLRALGRESEAAACLDELVARVPQNRQAWRALADLRYSRRELTLAVSAYDRVLALGGEDAEVLNLRGVCREGLRDYPGALEDYDRAQALAPLYAAVYYNRGTLLLLLQEHERGRADLRRYLELDPNSPNVEQVQGLLKEE